MARNTPIQGTAADVIKLAMVRVWKRLRNEKMESRLILTVHDELIVEAPQAEAEKAAPVSYTHLDVYKRQASGRVMEKAGFLYHHDAIDHKFDGTPVECRSYLLTRERYNRKDLP